MVPCFACCFECRAFFLQIICYKCDIFAGRVGRIDRHFYECLFLHGTTQKIVDTFFATQSWLHQEHAYQPDRRRASGCFACKSTSLILRHSYKFEPDECKMLCKCLEKKNTIGLKVCEWLSCSWILLGITEPRWRWTQIKTSTRNFFLSHFHA